MIQGEGRKLVSEEFTSYLPGGQEHFFEKLFFRTTPILVNNSARFPRGANCSFKVAPDKSARVVDANK